MTGGTGGSRFARPALFLAFLLASAAARAGGPDDALARAKSLGLAASPEWLRLLHYKPAGFLGAGARLEGDADSSDFYLAANGRRDAAAELEAAVRALWDKTPGPAPEPPRCRFPARSAWLIEKLGVDAASLPAADCSKYLDWRKLMDPSAATLIFASAYVNNPSSMFGHTFLRLERRKIGEGQRLLDNTLNFAAETGDDGGALFAFKGLSGLYPGKYTVQPYYMMVQQYNNIETRDLWEYRLALSPDEVDRLAMHAWEMGQATFPYYFLSKNCSYQLMPALEAVLPSRTLMPGSPPVVGPVDTVHAVLKSPGLVGAVSFRPSHATTMRQRRALLSKAEVRAADAYRTGRYEDGDRLSAGLPDARRALILDAAHDYVLYKGGFSPDVEEKIRELERPILIRRSKIDAPPVEPNPPAWAAPPDEGHLRKRLQGGAGASGDGGFVELAWRPGYHDLLDRPHGYVPGAEIEAFSWRLRYDDGIKRVHLKEAKIIDVLSVSPWDPWMKKPSWTVGTGLETAWELGRPANESLVYEGHLGTGQALPLGDAGSLFLLAVGEAAAGSVLRDGYRVGGSLRLGAATRLSARFRALVDGGLSAQAFGDKTPNHRLRAALNWAPARDRALRAEFLVRGPRKEGGLYAVLYH